MKKFFSSLFVLLIVASAFAQYGVKIQKPFTGSASSITPTLDGVSLDGTKMYAYDFLSYYFLSLDLPGYNNMTYVNSSSVYIGGADFDNEGNLYCIQASSNVLYKEDLETGTFTSLGTITGIPTSFLVGLAYDNQTGTMYCLQTYWGTSGSLYTIDLNTLTATLVGTITGMTNGEGLAFNAEDRMLYGFNFQSAQSQLLKINPATAAATVVGTTTSFLNYASGWFGDCDFNDETGELIFSTFDGSTTTTTIWSIDASNCTAASVGTVSNAQLVLAINTTGKPVPVKGYYFILVFLIPIGIIIRRRFF
ncbi:MAG: hypothetical protein GXX78_09730 [Bacteroidales bacterium]|nr:hypothetical protein [Bacteroidales bacterium]